MAKFDLTLLNINSDQENAIRRLFTENQWPFETRRCVIKDSTCVPRGAGPSSCDLDTEAVSRVCSTVRVQTWLSDPGGDGESGDTGPSTGLSSGVGQCAFCFCSPCVTNHRQRWLGTGQLPHRRNSGVRKVLYKKYWSMLDRRGAWNCALYLAKKTSSLHQDNPTRVNINREMMPDCVLKLVRELYPNPTGIPYQGHNWW